VLRCVVRKAYRRLPSGGRGLVWAFVSVIALVMLADRVDEFRVSQLATMAAFIVGILSIIILTGYSGQVSLGHGALLGVGGYSAALALNNLGWPIWVTFAAAVVGAAAVGAVLGVAAARLSGPYLAGVTLAFAVGLPSLANIFLFLGGESGLSFDVGYPPDRFGMDFSINKWYFWVTGLGAVIAVWVASNLVRSRYRRTWKAIRSDEVAAALSGVHVARSKVLAFTISAGFAGLAGALYATTLTLVTPDAFRLTLSFGLITGAVLGGIGYISGAFVGAAILVFLPPIIDTITVATGVPEGWATYIPGLLTGLLLIVTIIAQPEGAIGSLHHRRHSHAKGHKA
jgi:branched-chain amino acid transport system permease protein